MSATLSTFATSALSAKYQSNYATDEFNASVARIQASGILRGFRIAPATGNNRIELQIDPITLDSCAIFRNANGRAVTICVASTITALDLSAYLSQTVVIALWGVYTTAAATSATVKVYTLAEWNAGTDKNYAVKLGVVAAPAAATPVVAADIDMTGRSYAFKDKALDTDWVKLIANPSFEGYWENGGVNAGNKFMGWMASATAQWVFAVEASITRSGGRSLKATASGAETSDLIYGMKNEEATGSSSIELFAVGAGDEVYLEAWVRPDSPVNATLFFRVLAVDADGSTVRGYKDVYAPTTGSTFQQVEAGFVVPADSGFLMVFARYTCSGGGSGSFYLDDVQLYLRPRNRTGAASVGYGTPTVRALAVGDPYYSRRYILSQSSANESLVIYPSTGGTPSAPFLQVGRTGQTLGLSLTREILQPKGITSATAPTAHTFYSSQHLKAWCLTSVTATIVDGYNIASIALEDTDMRGLVTFHTALKDANYVVNITIARNGDPGNGAVAVYVPEIFTKTTTSFKFRIREMVTFTAMDILAANVGLCIVVNGRWASET